MAELTVVRRLEAAGFRAWPAASVSYDGAWAVRLSPDHPARRLNSVNPLDPRDEKDLDLRIARASERFRAIGRPLTFRLSPLAGPGLRSHLDAHGWSLEDESVVMRAALDGDALDNAMDRISLKDIGRFVTALVAVRGYDLSLRPGLMSVIAAIPCETGLFVLEQDGVPLATAICVQDRDLAGLFEVATAPGERGRGHGRRLMLSALRWARQHGASQGWLQVEAANATALGLYGSLGFRELYRYHYRQPPEIGR